VFDNVTDEMSIARTRSRPRDEHPAFKSVDEVIDRANNTFYAWPPRSGPAT